MKVTRLRTRIVSLPFSPPIAGGFEIRTADCVLVFLDTDAGLTGEGVAFVLNGHRLALLHNLILSLEPLTVGCDPFRSSDVTARAWGELAPFGRVGLSAIGVAAIECALWDLRGKALALNVAHMIGAYRAAVPVYHSGALWPDRDLDALQREAADLVAKGYRALKMRVGKFPLEIDIARVRAVREAIGFDIDLMADANQRMSVEGAIRFGRMVEEFQLRWLEEPVHCLNHTGEAAVAAALDTPVASGESEYTSRNMHGMLRLQCADVLMPDLMRMGGPSEFMKAGHLAEAFGVPISSHLFPEMSLPLLAATANVAYLEYMPWLEPLYLERIELDGNGRAVLPERPGWGFGFDPAAVERYAA